MQSGLSSRFACLLGLACILGTLSPSPASPSPEVARLNFVSNEGVIVDEVEQGSAGDLAGFRPGDLLENWSQGRASGTIDSPFTLAEIEVEQEPLGQVSITGHRGNQQQSWLVGVGVWTLNVHPLFSPELERLYQQGRDRLKAGISAKPKNNGAQRQPRFQTAMHGWPHGFGAKSAKRISRRATGRSATRHFNTPFARQIPWGRVFASRCFKLGR